MQHYDFFGRAVSRLGVGTVQYGLSYGINNKTGQTPTADIDAVFEKCRQRGVTFLDTARAYGSSEARIADALDRLGARDDFIVATKLDLPGDWESMDEPGLLAAARASLEGSLAALRVDSLELCLLHTERYLRFPCLWNFLLDAVASGQVRHAGVSVEVGPSGAEACFGLPGLEALQIPFNVFDGRWAKSGFFEKAGKSGVLVVSRSSYLQGLVLMAPDELPANLSYARAYIERLEDIAGRYGMDRKILSLRYVFSRPEIGTSILGMDTAAQFDENYDIFMRGPLGPEILAEVSAAFDEVPEHCVNPALWKTVRP